MTWESQTPTDAEWIYWLLRDGIWDDQGAWDDGDIWNDSPTEWVAQSPEDVTWS